MSHRAIQEAWNALVPLARERGIRAAIWTRPAPSRIRGMRRLNALRAKLGQGVAAIMAEAIPLDLERYTFGVEIEAAVSSNLVRSQDNMGMATRMAVQAAMRRQGFAAHVAGYNDHLAQRVDWKIKSDGSLGNYAETAELVSPVLKGADGFANLRKVATWATETGWTIRSVCGLHVHIGVPHWTPAHFRRLARLYRKYEAVIDSFMAPSRRGPRGGNGFACSLVFNDADLDRATTINRIANVVAGGGANGSGSKYRKLNMLAYAVHGTVEFRHHQGTTDPVKIERWVKFCMRMVNACENDVADAPVTLDGLLDLLKAEDADKAFFAERQKTFSRSQNATL